MNHAFANAIAALLIAAHVASAQDKPGEAAGKAVGEALGYGCMLFCVAPCGLLFSWLVIGFFLLAFVSADARDRGMDSGSWTLVMLSLGPIGLLIYLMSRTQGDLIYCPSCGNGRLRVSARCPHCGNA